MCLIWLLLLSALMGTTTAQQCDPQTQYQEGDQCCRLCGPGTRMTNLGGCTEPQCKPCERNEYQDSYTKELKCQRQPYCDPNKNFEFADHESKTERTTCKCQEGYHCSSEECITCVPHKICQPGFRVKTEGNWTHDTVCEKCPKDTYSSEMSSKACKEMTPCETVDQQGTAASDNICAPEKRSHLIATIVLVTVLGAAVIGFVLWYFCGKPGYSKVKGYCGSCQENKNEPLREVKPVEERTPEENEDDPSIQETSTLVHLSDNKNVVAQENGKEEILSSVSTGNSEIPVETLDSSYGCNTYF